MKEAAVEASFILSPMVRQGIPGGDYFPLKMWFSGLPTSRRSTQSLETHVSTSEVVFPHFYVQVPPHCATSQNSQDLIRSRTRGGAEVHVESRKQEDGRDSLSFASFLVFFINAENLANTSFPAELDSACWVPSLGYLEKFKMRVSQISHV